MKDAGIMGTYTREELMNSLETALGGAQYGPGWRLILSPREREAILEWAISHGVQIRKPRIKRGDVLESLEDAAKYEIPDSTAFRALSTDRLWSWDRSRGFNKSAYELFGPFRCIDVPGDDDE